MRGSQVNILMMKPRTAALIRQLILFSLVILPWRQAHAFALLGPYEDWMQPSNGFRVPASFFAAYTPGDIGGPMTIGNGYRWNVPVLTYGFDPSFTNFFGSNGVAAVAGAIQLLNDISSASSIEVTNYPNNATETNSEAEAQYAIDLQSVALSLFLEHLGFTTPTFSIYIMSNWIPQYGWDTQNIITRNYDPSTLLLTTSVNGNTYNGEIWSGYSFGDDAALIVPILDTSIPPETHISAIADRTLTVGQFYTGLTADDAGGLRFLYSTNNVNFENLLPGIVAVGSNALVNGAWRPGIEKIMFIPQPRDLDSGQFLPMTNQYEDGYLTNGQLVYQSVERITCQPDFLFCAGDVGSNYPGLLLYSRSGTSNWVNNAMLNGGLSSAGPGVIQPPVKITFEKIGAQLYEYDTDSATNVIFEVPTCWGTFGQSGSPPILYPASQTGLSSLVVRICFPTDPNFPVPSDREVEISLTSTTGSCFILQTSTDLISWTSLETNANNGGIWTLVNPPQDNSRFYRIVPK